jgi:hypothetical protein
MGVQILTSDPTKTNETGEYVAVRTCRDPHDETVTLATIQRFVEKTVKRTPQEADWHIKTLLHEQPMTHDAALGFATCYAERKNIPVIYTPLD